MIGRRHSRRPNEAGFTLVELLVALTLLGLISVVLFGGLRFGTRAWEASSVQAERLAKVQAVQGLLRRRIAQALPPGPEGTRVAGPEEGRAVFSGDSDALQFLAVVPSRAGVGGIYAFDLTVIDDGEGARLELTWRLHRADDDEAARDEIPAAGLGGRRILIDGLARAQFRYFGAMGPGQAADWGDSWDAGAGLPGLIAIEAEFPEGDGRAWPVLRVAPKLGVSKPSG
jgi:general secretion pathway protein J